MSLPARARSIGTSTTPLAANGIWDSEQFQRVGEPFNINYYGGDEHTRVRGWVVTDQAGSLLFQVRQDDGITFLNLYPAVVVPAANPNEVSAVIDVLLTSRFIRVRYVNGAVAQAVFEIHLYLESMA